MVQAVDTLTVTPPRFSPDGGSFYFSVPVQLIADSLPPQAIYEYSLDNGQSWQTGQQFTVISGGKILARLRIGDRPSRSRAVTFSLSYKRMLVIGNSIMSHLPDPSVGWFNSNGMAASAPEKDFVHLLNTRLATLYPPVSYRLQSGGNFEREFGRSTYSLDEFSEPLQQFKPDLIVLRIGENIDEGAVVSRNYESQLGQLLDRLANYGQPVRIVVTTSVWSHPLADVVTRRVVAAKGHALVDLSCMVGQGQYFASQYANPGVAAHPNDAGMERIADSIWDKIQ
ncbi:SGNH/GDSL hydrolase family protein [Spirosoma sp. KUDC1026]|nr:SGNH/GDSL hydrolase family protein [Spirosoma sp. KUDC1026]